MAACFNPATLGTLHDYLTETCGFSPVDVPAYQGKHERVYEREHLRVPRLFVRVYTSLSPQAGVVRSRGKDAIRVCLLYRTGATTLECVGVARSKRVNRAGTTASLLDRIRERARDMYYVANKVAKTDLCPRCAAPRFVDSGRCVCCRTR